MREAAGTQLAMTYIGRRKATVAQWVALRPLLEVCAREKGYEGGGCRRASWWRQEAKEKQLWSTLAGILQDDNRWRRFGESVMQYVPEGGRVAGWELGIMGRRQETPRWVNDLVW